jgi:pimeloyl-ACP methyl ester carboxylesterase
MVAVAAPAATAQDAGFMFYSPLAEGWYRGGKYFEWTSTTRNNNSRKVKVFWRTLGDRSKPALVMLHGFPNSSLDYAELAPLLEKDYFVAVLDFPGFGFSDKPQDGYSYMLEDDARLVDYFVREVVGLPRFNLYTHDRGVSVGLAFLGHYLESERRPYQILYHFLSNSGMFLPLANLLPGQTALLDPVKGPAAVAFMRARPRVTKGTPHQVGDADIEAFNDGIGARLHVGKYQLERAANETRWLANLPKSPVPTALLWGLTDTVNPPRIANHVWAAYLNERAVESSYWWVPGAGHYPQRERPDEVAQIVRFCLEGKVPARDKESAFMSGQTGQQTATAPIYVGHSRIEPVKFPGAVEYDPAGYKPR